MSRFYAKPTGGYTYDSVEGTANIKAVYNYLFPKGFTKESIIGILGNVEGESNYNPWLWENGTYNPNDGYGLFQFTPASEYINASWLPDYAPNIDPPNISPTADPDDAYAQLYAFINDTFGKWDSYCWRVDWNTTTYADLWNKRTYILNTYGNGSSLTLAQFKTINDYSDSTFAFLACYEKPLIPNYLQRLGYAANVKTILDNYNPSDILFLKHIRDRQFNII